VYGVCNYGKRKVSSVAGRRSNFFLFFFTLSLLNDPISWCRSHSALIHMAFDSLHLSPSDCALKVMKSKRLDSKSKGQSTCNDECQRSHRLLADLIKYFSYVAFAGLFIFSYQFPFLVYSFSCSFFFSFLDTSFYFTLTLHCAMKQPFWPFSIRFRLLTLTVLR
jgi:hypothetical protein